MGVWNTTGNIFRLIIVVGTIIAIGLQSSAQTQCNYALYKNDETQGIGVWYSMTNGVCGTEMYDPEESDPFIWTARSSLSISMILAIVGGILVAFEWCICQVCCAGCLEMCCYMGAWLCGGGVNAIFGCELCVGVGFEDVTADAIEAAAAEGNLCKIGPASTLNAVATIIYFILCIVLCCTPEPEPIWKQ